MNKSASHKSRKTSDKISDKITEITDEPTLDASNVTSDSTDASSSVTPKNALGGPDVDNIDSEQTPVAAPQPVVPLPVITRADDTKLNLSQASQKVAEHYKCGLSFKSVFPLQYCDGATVEFINDKGIVIAAAKLRYGNNITVDTSSGNMSMGVYLSDLSFARETLNIHVPEPNFM
jgi:hypothetical protein